MKREAIEFKNTVESNNMINTLCLLPVILCHIYKLPVSFFHVVVFKMLSLIIPSLLIAET